MKFLLIVSVILLAGCTSTKNSSEKRTFYTHLPMAVPPSGLSGDPTLKVHVIVNGEVAHPGPYSMAAGLMVGDVLHEAGGFTEFGHQTGIQIIRGEKKFCLDFQRVRRHKGHDVILEDGDKIYVPRETSMH